MNIKRKICNEFVKSPYATPYCVIDHSRTDNGTRDLKNLIETNNGIAPCLTTRGDILGIVIEDMKERKKESSVFTEMEKAMFTEDGNVKRYLNSNTVDKFKDGQMATLSYPNGYGHGTRVHNESVALTTGQQPVVKTNLRIRKLVPLETCKLMGFSKEDYQAMRDIGMSDMQIYHCCGDSIVTTCLMALFGQMLMSEEELRQKIEDYVETLTKENA